MTRILLIDDDESFRKAYQAILARAGYDVVAAANGVEADKVFAEAAPDLVVTDLIMPEKEGIATMQALRRQKPNLKIIAISGGGRVHAEDYLALAKGFGAARTLAKPFAPEKLLTAIQEVLSSG